MPKNVKWDGVFQSMTDTWLPLFGVVAALVVIALVVCFIKKKRNK